MSAADFHPRNAMRAAHARTALETYAECAVSETSDDGLVDLITDCGHLASEHGYDFVHLVERALKCWAEEQRDPEGLDVAPEFPRFEVLRTSAPRSRRGRRRS
jgi:hypothetical protein